jgi:hypothetical protein
VSSYSAAIDRQTMADAILKCGPWFAGHDDDALIDHARAQAKAIEQDTASLSDRVIAYQRAARRVERHHLTPPEGVSLGGALERMGCSLWWRRQLRRLSSRRLEQRQRVLGRVSRRAGIYVSQEGYKRRNDQNRRNAAMLEAMAATNQAGQEYTLAELSEIGLANPNHRRAELMLRISDTEAEARRLGHVGMFYTFTCPSRFHAVLSKGCRINGKYQGDTPREAQAYLQSMWSKARAKIGRDDLGIYGVRVVEPHHDGTPHWHLLLWMEPGDVSAVTQILRSYATEADPEELATDRARRARFDATAIDYAKGTAAGYVAKYISKNINGSQFDDLDIYGHRLDDAAPRIEAWAATWGIRQFQFIGLPSVTVWRELRRLRTPKHVEEWEQATRPDAEAAAIFAEVRGYADAGQWDKYMRAMGGPMAGRQGQPIRPWRVIRQDSEGQLLDQSTGELTFDVLGRYGEPVAGTWGLTVESATGQADYLTRINRWEIATKATPGRDPLEGLTFDGGGVAWTRVNNCTPPVATPHRSPLDPWEWHITESFRRMKPTADRATVEALQEQVAIEAGRYAIEADRAGRERQERRENRQRLEQGRAVVLDWLLAGEITINEAKEVMQA